MAAATSHGQRGMPRERAAWRSKESVAVAAPLKVGAEGRGRRSDSESGKLTAEMATVWPEICQRWRPGVAGVLEVQREPSGEVDSVSSMGFPSGPRRSMALLWSAGVAVCWRGLPGGVWREAVASEGRVRRRISAKAGRKTPWVDQSESGVVRGRLKMRMGADLVVISRMAGMASE